ncbi:MAG: phosphate signaling complex protein PhoU, partial [Firmicutes bacterium]|nr:phosphate signaling complex protein PhoU [Bacillota bacterium]
MRRRFDEQLALLNKELLEMGSLCEGIISLSVNALLCGDDSLAKKVSGLESEINRKESEIEALCMRLLLQQQPVAKDLRQISSALKMITDMERIGDQALDIAELIVYFKGRSVEDFSEITAMANAVITMVTDSVDAFVTKDLNAVEKVLAEDDLVDELFDKVKKTLIELIAAHPEEGEFAMDLLMVAKYFERIGDHAENLAEWVEYSITGIHRGGE